jgi:hypothetical protein
MRIALRNVDFLARGLLSLEVGTRYPPERSHIHAMERSRTPGSKRKVAEDSHRFPPGGSYEFTAVGTDRRNRV